MINPVIISSGKTYESEYITEWLRSSKRCPITNATLSRVLMTKNDLLDEFIMEWCQLNKLERGSEELATELFVDGIDSLLNRISSSLSVSDQIEAADDQAWNGKDRFTATWIESTKDDLPPSLPW